jgi:hypothetical protein
MTSLFDLLVDDADREGAGHLASGVAAHPVGDHEKRELFVDEVVVLVVVTHAADVGAGVEADILGEAHLGARVDEGGRQGKRAHAGPP